MKQEEQIIRTEYSELMQKSYIDYAMSVIIARALPDVRDGLKPVQRRTLYDMYELGIRYDKPYRKCARIVGDTMGKYHPHGDSSIYGALVVLAQDFKMGQTLVDGHGNFGSIEGDGAAAMRYTEARLQKLTQETFLADLDKDVVDFVPNFDETEKEPEDLPAQWGFQWSTDPKKALPFIALSTSPYAKDDCCTHDGHVWRSGQDNNVWAPGTVGVKWDDLGEIEEVMEAD